MASPKAILRSFVGKCFSRAKTYCLEARFEELTQKGVITIGRGSYGFPEILTYAGCSDRLRIGRYCSIANGAVVFLGGNHPTAWVSSFPFRAIYRLPGAFTDGMPTSKGDVTLGNDVWIGFGAMLLSGSTIGDGAVVAAGAVVAGTVAPYSIVGGVPARQLALRFPVKTIDKLLKIRWWDWPEERVMESVALLSSNNVDEFIRLNNARL